ncbi:MAG TPA: NRAMP family divalent metal transporter [Solirubrobacteraceae bacterium]|jgi:NRAMP (natural resistance-associated macrophage protein)-like metal ion transporter|nr:NRAMP family divalent metal transporter [Solirubrobacteraceae bacterium]
MTTTPRRERAVLDSAHVGDIQGAFGTLAQHDTGARRSWRARALALLAILGPGLIVMVGDNDAGGVATYSQAGQNYGTSLLWVLILLIPVLIVNQEMVVRLGAVTGVGHARLINERFGRFWGWFSVGDLFLLNFLTIVTEFIGVSLALSYFGVSDYISVPIAGALLVAMTASGSFRRWERMMFLFVFANLLVIPLFFMSHPDAGTVARDFVVPGIQGGATSTSVLLIIAIVGTTVAPWQLFFQQSNIIDKRITPRWINYERLDTWIGAIVVVIGAAALMAVSAFAFRNSSYFGHFTDAGGTARGLRAQLGSVAGAFFALVLLNASLIGAAALTLSTSYAFGDMFGTKSSLHRSFRDARGFYAMFAGLIAGAAAIVLIPGAPLGVITTSVQALAGVLLPSATVFLLLLCNDRAVLGPWRNPTWLNVLATLIVGILVLLSAILMATTVFPHIDVTEFALVGGAGFVVTMLAFGAWTLRGSREGAQVTVIEDGPAVPRSQWTMPQLTFLEPAVWSRGRKTAMLAMRGYLLVSMVLLVVKAVQLGGA